MRPLVRVSAILLGALVLLLLSAPQASAHVRATTGYGELTPSDPGADLVLSLEYDLLARAIGMGTEAIEAPDDSARAEALGAYPGPLTTYLDNRLSLSIDGIGCEPTLESTGMESRQNVSYARLGLAFACPGSADGEYTFEYEVFRATDGVVDDHTLLLEYDLNGESGRTVLDGAHPSMTTGEQSIVGSAARFTSLGVHHILAGLDHILFVVVLLLGARTIRDVFAVTSVFTLAHSVTLGMALLGWIEVPAAIVEPLIALSIVYVALDNIVGEPSRSRLAAVFGFGLLHGLGFAGALRVTDELSWGWIGSLLSFNIGIEIGQALLILLIFPLLVLIRRLRWSVFALAGATSFVALLGLFWFFERITVI